MLVSLLRINQNTCISGFCKPSKERLYTSSSLLNCYAGRHKDSADMCLHDFFYDCKQNTQKARQKCVPHFVGSARPVYPIEALPRQNPVACVDISDLDLWLNYPWDIQNTRYISSIICSFGNETYSSTYSMLVVSCLCHSLTQKDSFIISNKYMKF